MQVLCFYFALKDIENIDIGVSRGFSRKWSIHMVAPYPDLSTWKRFFKHGDAGWSKFRDVGCGFVSFRYLKSILRDHPFQANRYMSGDGDGVVGCVRCTCRSLQCSQLSQLCGRRPGWGGQHAWHCHGDVSMLPHALDVFFSWSSNP